MNGKALLLTIVASALTAAAAFADAPPAMSAVEGMPAKVAPASAKPDAAAAAPTE